MSDWGVKGVSETGSGGLGRYDLVCMSSSSLLVSMRILVQAQKASGFLTVPKWYYAASPKAFMRK